MTPRRTLIDAPRYTPLKEEIGIVPTSVLDPWVSSELRRRDDTLRKVVGSIGLATVSGRYASGAEARGIASPVVAEILLKLYGVPNGSVLDPFSGSGAWALAATINGFAYHGIEIRPDVATASREMVERATGVAPNIRHGDATNSACYPSGAFDVVLTCPPYGPLEIYSDDPHDLSTLPHEEFLMSIHAVLLHTITRVYEGSFAVWVIGNWLDGDEYVDFKGELIRLAIASGWKFYDDVVLVGKLGTAGLRVGNSWRNKRLVRRHEYAVVLMAPG